MLNSVVYTVALCMIVINLVGIDFIPENMSIFAASFKLFILWLRVTSLFAE